MDERALNKDIMNSFQKSSRVAIKYVNKLISVNHDYTLRYHSVCHSEKLPAVRNPAFLRYEAPELLKHCQIDDDRHRLALAQAIPQDGRIALPFDLRYHIQEGEAKENIFSSGRSQEVEPDSSDLGLPRDCTEENNNNLLKHLEAKKRSKVDELESFFSQVVKEFGSFIIQDIDPKSTRKVQYNLGTSDPFVTVSEERFEMHSKSVHLLRTSLKSEFLSWLSTQRSFCEIDPSFSQSAPWQRVIICQGLSLSSVAREKRLSIPFLVFPDKSDPIQIAIDLHQADECRGGSDLTNPYSNPQNAFHITFFKRIHPSTATPGLVKAMKQLKLKVGRLYEGPREANHKTGTKSWDKLAFCKSSFTVITAVRRSQADPEPKHMSVIDWYWTMLILSPPDFFSLKENNSGGDWTALESGQSSQGTAELCTIVRALAQVEFEWRAFSKHIGSLLVENFMDPTTYTKLLFDDASFSRSRLYFWILECLNEFDIVIGDNIKQWKLYRQARVYTLLERFAEPPLAPSSHKLPASSSEKTPETLPAQFDRARELQRIRELDGKAERIRQSLEDLRAHFKATQARVQALRDGLFNASALMESRSSTRLGMNVQLLTYVSIFYLPLAFCAALWAIPNITDGSTRSPFIATAVLVGFATYAVVLNLENIARLTGKVFLGRRKRLSQEMQEDPDESWQVIQEQFQEFPPSEDRKTPSEWWVLWHQIIKLVRRKERSSTGFVSDDTSDSSEESVEPPQKQSLREWVRGIFGKSNAALGAGTTGEVRAKKTRLFRRKKAVDEASADVEA